MTDISDMANNLPYDHTIKYLLTPVVKWLLVVCAKGVTAEVTTSLGTFTTSVTIQRKDP